MKINMDKIEVLHLSRNSDKYLGVAFTSDGRQSEELDTRISQTSAVIRALHRSVVMKHKTSKKAKLSIFKAVFVPILTFGHESWVITERVQSLAITSEVKILQKIEEVALFKWLSTRGR